MARILIQHPDGDPTHRVSVPEEAAERLYPDWTPIREETPDDFTVVGIPRPLEGRRPPRQKDAAPISKRRRDKKLSPIDQAIADEGD